MKKALWKVFSYCNYSFWATTIYLVSKVYFRLRYRYLEKLPKRGRLIVVANHQSFLDPPLVGIGIGRHAFFMARESLFRGLFGIHLRSLNAYPIDKDRPVSGIKETLRHLQDEQAVLIFPEGARSFDGELQPFQGGILAVAKRSKAPIVPCAIRGAFEAFPRTAKFPKPHKVVVTYGRIIPAEDVQAMTNDQLIETLTARIQELLGSERV